ncbi:hypothetical protein SUGI_0899630 [Cryptomeria japonica]|uniref:uncharacterized protein LOC131062786 isoform X2 n=1 Tax=Cryptomeria japonica TaxID=3369 RepID=UPI0024149953|nr:uncharacterized protein LOC131062786 isoform X2 [Cryptomeria japonica]GLJ43316.1 hypothetical protein SUGI_0899630 [Cryptomeria japonica]
MFGSLSGFLSIYLACTAKYLNSESIHCCNSLLRAYGLASLHWQCLKNGSLRCMNLPYFIGNALRMDPRDVNAILSRNDSNGDSMRSRLKRLLNGLHVETTHIKYGYRNKSMTDVPVDALVFDSNGEQLIVTDYFQKQYNIRLGFREFPAIEAGSKDNFQRLKLVARIIISTFPLSFVVFRRINLI